MAKRNRSRIKKRRKRQLNKRIFATSKAVPTVKVQLPPPVQLYLGKYAAENEEYQKALDAIYQGKVKPYDRYINPNATLVHRCSQCKSKFYARPSWLIDGVQPHVCYKPPAGGKSGNVKLKKVKDTTWDEFQQMVWNDYTYREIAKKMGVNREIIEDYFRTEGLI